ncbi:FAD-dependent monooxygenase [Dactylosporangium vinaceum]|uniref:FAD-dependent monooxygenase n=1 Tax=Dactylosporangium vinaceum TaxID=53362 RepID=A0ABV5LY37_9ACTN|nr:FAD-dependent monooxygenase [Dactylosporangium vinaceum]UAB97642.1 FAD-dependent monooxygenase [Dactylosporangium vinaceum]
MTQPVLIAGAGPVGLMLAYELGLAGVPAVVLERAATPPAPEQSRGMAVNGAVVELLEQRGLMEAIRPFGMSFPRAHFGHIWLDPTTVGQRHPFNFAVPHALLQRVLEERAVKLGAQVRRDAEVVGVRQDADGVEADVVGADGARATVRGAYLVGCDGAGSRVRALAGIGFSGADVPFLGILADVRVEPGDPMFAQIGVNQYQNGICTVAPIGPQALRVMTGEFDTEPGVESAPVPPEDFAAAYARITGTALTGHPVRLSYWTTATRLADQYRTGRVFLAGDAAHVHFPLGGQALSTGLEDAVNLGWKLAAAHGGWAPPGLLDTYHGERHPVGARACRTTSAQTALMHPMSRVAPLREIFAELTAFPDVNAYLVNMVGGLDVRYPAESGGELVGRRLADVPLTTGAGATSVAKLLTSGLGVLLDLGAGVTLPDGFDDRIDAVTAEPSDEIPATAVLLRPDGRVAWASPATAGGLAGNGLAEAAGQWFGKSMMVGVAA